MQNKKKGFTLIELLVVVAIIAILALIVLLALNPVEMQRRSRDSRRLSDLGTVRKAIDLALADGNKGNLAAASVSLSATDDPTDFAGMGLDISTYLSAIPQDPSTNSVNNIQLITAPSSGVCGTETIAPVAYSFWSDGDVYVLKSRLESIDNCEALMSDGNNDDEFYQIGTDPGLDEVNP